MVLYLPAHSSREVHTHSYHRIKQSSTEASISSNYIARLVKDRQNLYTKKCRKRKSGEGVYWWSNCSSWPSSTRRPFFTLPERGVTVTMCIIQEGGSNSNSHPVHRLHLHQIRQPFLVLQRRQALPASPDSPSLPVLPRYPLDLDHRVCHRGRGGQWLPWLRLDLCFLVHLGDPGVQ